MRHIFSAVAVLALLALVALPAQAVGLNTVFSQSYGKSATSTISSTYADTLQADTLELAVNYNEAALSFAVEFGDSVDILSIVAYRSYDSQWLAVAGSLDTLLAATTLTAAGARAANIPIDVATYPRCQKIRIIVKYGDDAKFGVTSPTVKYIVSRAYRF